MVGSFGEDRLEKHSAPARISPLRRGFALSGFGRDCAVAGQPVLQISFHHEAALANLDAWQTTLKNLSVKGRGRQAGNVAGGLNAEGEGFWSIDKVAVVGSVRAMF